jgi:hypothetical protein
MFQKKIHLYINFGQRHDGMNLGACYFSRENSLFDTMLKSSSLFDIGIFFLPYLTLGLKFVPYMTLPSNLLDYSVQMPVRHVSFLLEWPDYPCYIIRLCISVNEISCKLCTSMYREEQRKKARSMSPMSRQPRTDEVNLTIECVRWGVLVRLWPSHTSLKSLILRFLSLISIRQSRWKQSGRTRSYCYARNWRIILFEKLRATLILG